MTKLTFDDDDERAFHEAVILFQRLNKNVRLLPDGNTELLGRIVGQIMRSWADRVGTPDLEIYS